MYTEPIHLSLHDRSVIWKRISSLATHLNDLASPIGNPDITHGLVQEYDETRGRIKELRLLLDQEK